MKQKNLNLLFRIIKHLYIFDGYSELPLKDRNVIQNSMFLTLSVLSSQINSPSKAKWVKNHKKEYQENLLHILTDKTLTEYESFQQAKNLLSNT